jgi:hypothetical protein
MTSIRPDWIPFELSMLKNYSNKYVFINIKREVIYQALCTGDGFLTLKGYICPAEISHIATFEILKPKSITPRKKKEFDYSKALSQYY